MPATLAHTLQPLAPRMLPPSGRTDRSRPHARGWHAPSPSPSRGRSAPGLDLNSCRTRPQRKGDADLRVHLTMSDEPVNVTQLLRAAASGERRDLDALMGAIYNDLRRLAVSHMRSERDDHTLQPTAVVHEAYLKLVDQRTTDWKDRAHFFAVASRIIRRLLVDHAREREAAKRGGGARRIGLDDADLTAAMPDAQLVALDEALTELAALNDRQAQIVELRFFGGLTIDEIAEALGIGKRSVDRDWQIARAWLYCRLTADGAEPNDGP